LRVIDKNLSIVLRTLRTCLSETRALRRVTYRFFGKHLLLRMLDLRRGTKIAEYLKILQATEWFKREEILRLQQQGLRRLVKHAYENVPYYHRVFKERGLRPSDVKTVEDLKKLPILKKTEIAWMPRELIAKNISVGQMNPCRTAGTTAKPLKFYKTKEDLSWGHAAELRAYGWAGYQFGDKYGLIRTFQPHELQNPLLMLENLLKRRVVLNVYELSRGSIASFAQKMSRFRPDYLAGWSSKIYMLATYVLEKGLSLKLRAIFSSSETLLPSQRRVIERTFGCEVYDFYGSREVLSMASECAKHSGYHVQSENIVLEFVKHAEQVAPGETGAILVTDLRNYAMPFIRYDIGDTGKPSDDDCPCGRGLPLFKSLEGRTYEFFVTSRSITALKDFDIFFENLPVRMFQIVQRDRDEILIKIVKADGYSEKDTDFIKRNISFPRAQRPTIEVELVDSIPSEKSGKKRYVISKLPTHDWLENSWTKPTSE
jgi:phenylacetate-CoA ligase